MPARSRRVAWYPQPEILCGVGPTDQNTAENTCGAELGPFFNMNSPARSLFNGLGQGSRKVLLHQK
jgi:hypothetical protein